MAFLEKKLATVTDAITGKELETRKQLVRIGMTTKPNQSKAPVLLENVADLARALMAHKTRDTSGRLGVAQVVLMADPGTGKTWASLQLTLSIVDLEREGGDDAKYSSSVPVLISVQRIAFLSAQLASLQNRSDAQLESLDLLVEVLEREYPSHILVLKQALASRRLVVILDGFDEGAGTKPAVFGLVKALASGGHSFLLTSRPEGFSDLPEAAAFADAFLFQMDLLPLSKEQQRLVLQQQMDHESVFFSNLLSFTEARSTMDNLFVKNCPERRLEEIRNIKTDLVQPGSWKPDSPGEYYRSPSALKELVAFFLSESSLLTLSLSLSDYAAPPSTQCE